MNCPNCITEEQYRDGPYGGSVTVYTPCVPCALEASKPRKLSLHNDPRRYDEWEALYLAALEPTYERRAS